MARWPGSSASRRATTCAWKAGEDGASLRIVPIAWHLKEQEYFWSEEWQGKVRKSLKDLEKGRVGAHETVEGLIEELENAADRKNR